MKHQIKKLYGAPSEEIDAIYQSTPHDGIQLITTSRIIIGTKGGKTQKRKKNTKHTRK